VKAFNVVAEAPKRINWSARRATPIARRARSYSTPPR